MIIKNAIRFSTFMLMMTCAKANSTLGKEIAQLAKNENYKTDGVPERDAPQEEWDTFVEKIGEQYMHRAQRGKTTLSLLLEKYYALKEVEILGNKIAELAKEEGYEIKDIPEGNASQETWDTFVEAVAHKNVRHARIGKNLFDPLLEEYYELQERMNKINKLEKEKNDKKI